MSLTDSAAKLAGSAQDKVQQIFEGIADRYDFLNSFLSFGLDGFWRRKARDLVIEDGQSSILDLGTGTGKFLKLFLEVKTWAHVCGLDFSFSMLRRAQKQLPSGVQLVKGDFQHLPFQDSEFDLVISSFTLRSVQDVPQFLKQIYGVLQPQGKVAFLCLTRPKNFLVKLFYYPYLKFYIPFVGRLISGNREAYRFLASSIQSFQDPQETLAMMRQVGYVDLQLYSLYYGIVTLMVGRRGYG
jgi:demethylmenaquinone methyltransferase / 2-methoxy-6-polyprenyl-1,4-benzoquinol methylase